jgi:[CysO sulfur-carrier protein]-S-L-cysteine hydrolase
VRLTPAQRDELIAHAREEAPFECCGYVTIRDGRLEEVVRGENTRRSKYGFALDKDSLTRIAFIEDEGLEPGVYHSHPRTAAEPSQQDVNEAHYPNALYLIVGFSGGEPELRGWWIVDGKVKEEELVVE